MNGGHRLFRQLNSNHARIDTDAHRPGLVMSKEEGNPIDNFDTNLLCGFIERLRDDSIRCDVQHTKCSTKGRT